MILDWSGDPSYIGFPLIQTPSSFGGTPVVTPTARGNIDYDQVKVAARTGNGSQLLTWSPYPGSHSASGTAGQIAYDALGNYYFCYGANAWGRIGPAGYSNSF